MNCYPGWYNNMRVSGPGMRQYIGRTTSDADATSYTFTAAAIGPAGANRMVLVAVSTVHASGGGTITGVTIGGVTATAVVNVSSGGTFASNCALFRAAVPAGTTADVVVTVSATAFSCGIDVYAIYNLNSMVPFATASASAAASGTLLSTTLNIPASGVGVMSTVTYVATSFTLVGFTEDADTSFGTNPETMASGSNQDMAAQTGRTVSATAANANDRRVLVAASWS